MMRDHIGEKSRMPGVGWGYGAAIRRGDGELPRQYGWVGGGYAKLWVDPGERLVAYFAFPLMPPGDNALLDDFERLVYPALERTPAAP